MCQVQTSIALAQKHFWKTRKHVTFQRTCNHTGEPRQIPRGTQRIGVLTRTLWTAPVLRCFVRRDTCVALGGGLGNRLCQVAKQEMFFSTPNAAFLDLKNKSTGGVIWGEITEIICDQGRPPVAVQPTRRLLIFSLLPLPPAGILTR